MGKLGARAPGHYRDSGTKASGSGCHDWLACFPSHRVLDAVLGSFVHPFSHRRILNSTWHRCYTFKANLRLDIITKVPGVIRDEFVMSSLLLACAYTDLRVPLPVDASGTNAVVYATDATPSGYGGVTASCPTPLARSLYRQSIGRGENGRLDWGGDKTVLWEFCRMRRRRGE